jgi:hypothetical protein
VSTLPTIALTVGGVALIAFALRDIFQTLLHPEGRGRLARSVMRAVWTACKVPKRRSSLLLAGPLGILLVVGAWAGLLVLGWGLLLWPQLEDGFGLEAPGATGLADAVHVSLTTLTTLGSTEPPNEDWLRVLLPLEALLGFGLLSASISYLLLLYPALARRHCMAYEVALLREWDDQAGLPLEQFDEVAAGHLYPDLTSRVVAVERDLVNLPAIYYFTERDERFSLAAAAPYLLSLARRGLEGPEQVRFRAQLLVNALDDLAQSTGSLFPWTRADSTDGIFAAYAWDHRIGEPKHSQTPAAISGGCR